ncbi:hypothetical protein V7114_06930 [Neobacillus niacini]|uniref:hypothetical protein n=1 Tax=Neobacillus niacini TaxID=86668 RepID=UPI002FFF6E08
MKKLLFGLLVLGILVGLSSSVSANEKVATPKFEESTPTYETMFVPGQGGGGGD